MTIRRMLVWLNRMMTLPFALAIFLGASSNAYAARLALVIGNDQYRQVSVLKNARNDARLMAALLREAGFEVVGDVRTDLDRNNLWRALEQFKGRIRKGDEVVFYFAGHGVQVDASQFLLPVDIGNDSEDQVSRDAVPLHQVQRMLAEAQFALLVIDACRDNPFPPKPGSTRNIGDTRGLAPPAKAVDGSVVLLAAAAGQKALDIVPGVTTNNGLFTHELVKALRVPGQDVLSAVRRTRSHVEATARRANHAQRPSYVDEMSGEFVLFAAVASATRQELAPVAPPLVASILPEPVPAQRSQPVPALGAGPATAPAPAPQPTYLPGQNVKDCPTCPELVVVPAGTFHMGSDDMNEGPMRDVTLASFLLGVTEVTQGQWKAVMGSDPSAFTNCGADCPVENVSWADAQAYVQKLTERTGVVYRLPSEAEWEYAARAGSHTKWSFGDDEALLDDFAWFAKNSRLQTHRVRSKRPNAWGLYDMHGNVAEWVQDVAHSDYQGAPSDGSAWMTGSNQTTQRVFRGGASFLDAINSTSHARTFYPLESRGGGLVGFRVARSR